MQHLQVKLAETVIAVIGTSTCPPFQVPPAYHPFLAAGFRPEITLRVHYGDIPDLPLGERVFHSGGVWTLYRHRDKYLVVMADFLPGSRPYRLGVFDGTFSSGEIFIQRPIAEARPTPATSVNPLEHPLDQILLAVFLARRGLGMIVHACGVADHGRGLAFCGVSGAGKSTLARLWQEAEAGGALLSDERLIIRRLNRRFWAYGTPWPGEAHVFSPEKAPLAGIYILRHADRNSRQALSSPAAASQLLVRCFPPFFDRVGMENLLELLARITAEIPCYDLGFLPDRGIVDLVRCRR